MGALSKESGARDDQTRRGLLLLQRRLEEAQNSVRQIHNETQLLLAVSEARPLTAAEVARERQLRQQANWLRWEMQHLRMEFEFIVAGRYVKRRGRRDDG